MVSWFNCLSHRTINIFEENELRDTCKEHTALLWLVVVKLHSIFRHKSRKSNCQISVTNLKSRVRGYNILNRMNQEQSIQQIIKTQAASNILIKGLKTIKKKKKWREAHWERATTFLDTSALIHCLKMIIFTQHTRKIFSCENICSNKISDLTREQFYLNL